MNELLRRDDGLAADGPLRPAGGSPWKVVGFAGLKLAGIFLGIPVGTALLSLLSMPFLGTRRVIFAMNSAGGVFTLLSSVVVYLLLVILLEGRRRPYELALRRSWGLLAGLGMGAALLLVCYAVVALPGGYQIGVVSHIQYGELIRKVFAAGIIAGVSEELIYRGGLYRCIEDVLGTWGGILVSGLAFGLVHLRNPNGSLWAAAAIALEAGLPFGVLYALTRSLWVCIGFHAAWNITQGPLMGVPISGTSAGPSVLQTTTTGPDWLTGGSFGLEASVTTVLLLTLLSVVLGVRLARHGPVVKPLWKRRAGRPRSVS